MNNDKHFLSELQQILDGIENDGLTRSSELNDFLAHVAEEHSLQITLSNDEGYSQTKSLPLHNGSCTFTDITPAKYQLKLSGGRILWQGKLKEGYLMWQDDIPLKMAAQTHPDDTEATTRFELIPAECEMLVFAGLESGLVKITTFS